MLSAWHDLGMRTAKEHMTVAVGAVKRSGAAKPMPLGWLGRQRRYQEDAIYVSLSGSGVNVTCDMLNMPDSCVHETHRVRHGKSIL